MFYLNTLNTKIVSKRRNKAFFINMRIYITKYKFQMLGHMKEIKRGGGNMKVEKMYLEVEPRCFVWMTKSMQHDCKSRLRWTNTLSLLCTHHSSDYKHSNIHLQFSFLRKLDIYKSQEFFSRSNNWYETVHLNNNMVMWSDPLVSIQYKNFCWKSFLNTDTTE